MAIPAVAAMAVKHIATSVATDVIMDKAKGGSAEPKEGGGFLDKLIPDNLRGIVGAGNQEV